MLVEADALTLVAAACVPGRGGGVAGGFGVACDVASPGGAVDDLLEELASDTADTDAGSGCSLEDPVEGTGAEKAASRVVPEEVAIAMTGGGGGSAGRGRRGAISAKDDEAKERSDELYSESGGVEIIDGVLAPFAVCAAVVVAAVVELPAAAVPEPAALLVVPEPDA